MPDVAVMTHRRATCLLLLSLLLPVRLEGDPAGLDLRSLQLTIPYDPSIVQLDGLDRTGTPTEEWFLSQRTALGDGTVEDTLLVAMAGLDPIARRQLIDEMVELLSDRPDTTILLSTHIISDLERMADHVGIMDRGRMITSGGSMNAHCPHSESSSPLS